MKGRRNSTQKEKRIIDTLEPVMNQHRLVVNKCLIARDQTNFNEHPGDTWMKYQLFHQLTRITKDRGSLLHDDRLDVLAEAVAYWIEAMAKDQDTSIADHNDRLLEEDLMVFMEHVVGNNSQVLDPMENW